MPIKLETVLAKVDNCIPNKVNSALVREFYQFLKSKDTAENYQKGMVKAMVHFAEYLGPDTEFYDIKRAQQIIAFLDTKIKVVVRIR